MPHASLSHAVAHSFQNRAEIENSKSCACFYCFALFGPTDIRHWADSDDPEWGDDVELDIIRFPGLTATCPFCRDTSVIGSASGYAMTDEFLRLLHEYWHGTKPAV